MAKASETAFLSTPIAGCVMPKTLKQAQGHAKEHALCLFGLVGMCIVFVLFLPVFCPIRALVSGENAHRFSVFPQRNTGCLRTSDVLSGLHTHVAMKGR